MATLSKNKSLKTDGLVIQFVENKRRYTIFLGSKSYSRKTAERLKEIVETLQYYRRNGITVPDPATELWLKNAPEALRAKLAKTGLITVIRSKTCKEMWDGCLKSKTGVKPATMTAYHASQRIFFESFSATESIELLTPERLLEWKQAMLTEYATASVAGYIKVAKMVFGWAMEQEWLRKNPMANIPKGSFINRNNDRIISMGEYAKLLVSCPNQEWRTIIALARIGGLRCPSELRQLRWSDINWEHNRFLVRSPKTEQHENRHERIVPLFPELHTELKQHLLSDATEGNAFVIQGYQGTSWGLGNQFQKIADHAGLGTIKRPFDNMRLSRSNEVRAKWDVLKENLWIGHSGKVMKDHYAVLSDEEYADAAGMETRQDVPCKIPCSTVINSDKRGTFVF